MRLTSQASGSPGINEESLSWMIEKAVEKQVLRALSPVNPDEPSRPNMSRLAESLRDYELIGKNLKVLSWKLGQLESQAILEAHPDWLIDRQIQDIPAYFSSQFKAFSRPCIGEDIYSGWHFSLCRHLGGNPLTRKAWEWTFTVQAFWNLGIFSRNIPSRGIGFGCGTEPLISMLANFDAQILATDISADSEIAQSWQATASAAQNTGFLDNLFQSRLVSREKFLQRVSYTDLDMNNIPLGELEGQFDFAWSSCALEHLGTKRKGMEFVLNSSRCLKPGGIAIHTTEYDHTGTSNIDNWPTVLYNQQDILELQQELSAHGFELVEPAFYQTSHFIDGYVDLPPYPEHKQFDHSFFGEPGALDPSSIPQLNLSVDGFKCTSYALIVRRR
jgi:hypothetical protein